MASIDDLDEQTQLTYLVGRITQEDIGLDRQARSLFEVLVGKTSPAVWLADRDTARVIESCRRLLTIVADRIGDRDVVTLGDAALRAAKTAHEARNAYAHNLLIREAEGRWSVHKVATSPPQWQWTEPDTLTIDTLRQEHLDLVRQSWRIWGLQSLLHAQLDPEGGAIRQGEPDWLQILRGDFTPTADGSIFYGHD